VHTQPRIALIYPTTHCLDIPNHALPWYSTHLSCWYSRYLSTTMYEWVHVTVQSDMPASDCIIMHCIDILYLPCPDILYSYIPALQCNIAVSHWGPITHSVYARLSCCTIHTLLHPHVYMAASTCIHGCIHSIYMAAFTIHTWQHLTMYTCLHLTYSNSLYICLQRTAQAKWMKLDRCSRLLPHDQVNPKP